MKLEKHLANVESVVRRGDAEAAAGHLENALQHYRSAAIALGPLPLEDGRVATLAVHVCDRLGRTERQLGNPQGALEPIHMAVKLAEQVAQGTSLHADVLTSRAFAWRDAGQLELAEADFQQSLNITEAVEPASRRTANTLNDLARVSRLRADPVAAEKYARRAVSIIDQVAPNSLTAAIAYHNLRLALDDLDRSQEAVQYLEKSIPLLLQYAPESEAAADAVNRFCELLVSSREPADALSVIGDRLTHLAKDVPNARVVGVLHLWYGGLLQANTDRFEDALRSSNAAEQILRLYPDQADRVAWSQINQAKTRLLQDDVDGAEPLLRRALEHYERTSNTAGCARTQSLLARTVFMRLAAAGQAGSAAGLAAAREAARRFAVSQQYVDALNILKQSLLALDDDIRHSDDALWAFNDALDLTYKVGKSLIEYGRSIVDAWASRDPQARTTAIALDNLAVRARIQGHFREANEFGERALAIFRRLPNHPKDLAKCLNNLATTAFYEGNLSAAGKLLSEVRRILDEVAPESREMILCLSSIGVLRQRRGDNWGASIAYQQAVTLAERMNSRNYETALAKLNLIGFDIGRGEVTEQTLDSQNDVLSIMREIGNLEGTLGALENLAGIYLLLDRHNDAVATLREEAEIGEQQAPNSLATNEARVALASSLLLDNAVSDEAATLLDRAINVLRVMLTNSPTVRRALVLRGQLYARLDRIDDAITDLREAIAITEGLRMQVGETPRYRERYFTDAQQPYRLLVRLLSLSGAVPMMRHWHSITWNWGELEA